MKSRTISTQLTIMNMFVSLVALLVAGIVFFAYDWITFRESLIRNLSIQAEIAGLESVSALLFNDPSAAERTLDALRADPSVVSAMIKAEDGQTFAVYHRNGSSKNVALVSAKSETYLSTSNEVTVARTITSDRKTIGTVYIQSDLHRLNDRVIGLMKIVFTNLLSNAVKYTRNTQNAVIEVGEFDRNGTSCLFVKDNGAGFEQRYVHKLFGVFQRLHRADEFEGTGVGLATVRRIIDRHGGRIWAEGQVGKGAAFFFTLDSEPKSNHEEDKTEEI